MRKAIFMMLLTILSNSTVAETAGLLEINKSTIGTTYWIPIMRYKVGNFVRMSTVLDHKHTQMYNGKTYKSQLMTNEYDCEKKQIRLVFIGAYANEMGKGEEVYSNYEIGKWRPVVSVPGAQLEGEFEWKIACGKL